MKLKGKVALVTGGSRGIGKCISEAFAKEGAKVAVNFARYKEGALEAVRAIESNGGEAVAIHGDVSSMRSVQAVVNRVLKRFGRIDVLVNNAGVQSSAPFLELSLSEFRRIIGTNLNGAFCMSQTVARAMVAKGEGGVILNISSSVANRPFFKMAHYNASKAAVSSLTQSIAFELGPHGIRANEICPASVETDMNRNALRDPESRRVRLATIPLSRIGQPQDLIGAAVFLCSDDSSWITGASILVDGGLNVVPPLGVPPKNTSVTS